MLRDLVYPKIQGYLKIAAIFLHEKGFTPNQLTIGGMVLTLVSGLIFAQGHLFFGTLVMTIAGFGDMLDGALARETKQVTKFGAFLDSMTDRYSDFFIFGGLAVHFARQAHWGYFLLMLGILCGAYAVSYAKARAENFIENCGVGIFDRPVRMIVLGTGAVLTFLLPLCLWVLFIGSHVTALQRILHTEKALNKPKTIPPVS
ncbi:MAG TPA: CDP-alcohol phosphatidyltransferase family protein [Verrucomicrobiae bacterium]|jgi:CDP-diacylglycerol--glycerol-3-phosphate 3-phosphatidyltransferase|nr:CDP-alcohol phosphatidyltransferase family protein [Verrucomicrobiae bacterium]